MVGNMAMKKSNAIAEALVVILPLIKPFTKKRTTL